MSYALPVSIALAGAGLTLAAVNKFLTAFGYPSLTELVFGQGDQEETEPSTPVKKPEPKPPFDPEAAFGGKRWGELEAAYAEADRNNDSGLMKAIRDKMLGSPEGVKAMTDNPSLGGAILADVDVKALETMDLAGLFGGAKDNVVGNALLSLSKKKPLVGGGQTAHLVTQMDAGVLNDKTRTGGPLGARAYQKLFVSGNYDAIGGMIDKGVDTSIAAPAQGSGGGIYSGFVQPLQHIAQKYVREIALVDDGKKPEVQTPGAIKGAKQVLEKLQSSGTAKTLITYDEVKKSELMTEFAKDPGTIWGFEDIRLPYVEAAHDSRQEAEPVRMMELWDAVAESIDLSKNGYGKLMDAKDLDALIDSLVEKGEAKVKEGMRKDQSAKFHIVKDKDKFVENFKRDAKTMIEELSAQMPKGTFTSVGEDTNGKPVSDVAGIGADKLLNGFACKAGLWWAKKEKKPVYYCLDGIDWDDVTNYKVVKNKAIEACLEGKGAPHHEVITLVELREILKNWDEFKDTVKFSNKGKLMTKEEAEKEVKTRIEQMKKANALAGRAPAPPIATFSKALAALDPDLTARLNDGLKDGDEDARKERDKDARDIVRKSGYFEKIGKTRPQILIKYLMSKCGVLVTYKLVAPELVEAALRLPDAKPEEFKQLGTDLGKAIGKCNPKFQAPLKACLGRHPQLGPHLTA